MNDYNNYFEEIMKNNFNTLYVNYNANLKTFNEMNRSWSGATYQQKLTVANAVNHVGRILWGLSYRMPREIYVFLNPPKCTPKPQPVFVPKTTVVNKPVVKPAMPAKPRVVPTAATSPITFNQAAITNGNDNVVQVSDVNHVVASTNKRKKPAKKHDWTDVEIQHLLHGDVAWLEQVAKVTYDQMMSKTNDLGYRFNYGQPVSKPKVYNRLVIACHPDWENDMKNGDYSKMLQNKIRLSAICKCAKKLGYNIPAQYKNWASKASIAANG